MEEKKGRVTLGNFDYLARTQIILQNYSKI